jgi:hypothetical protein
MATLLTISTLPNRPTPWSVIRDSSSIGGKNLDEVQVYQDVELMEQRRCMEDRPKTLRLSAIVCYLVDFLHAYAQCTCYGL